LDELEAFAQSITKCLVIQMHELRSAIVQKTCRVIEGFSHKLKGKFRDTAKNILRPLIGVSPRSTQKSLFPSLSDRVFVGLW